MKIIRSRKEFISWRRKEKSSIGFVPTMGALHAGHLSLIKRSKKENKKTVVSIFVNPTQFGPNEDFKKYPRTEKSDFALLKKESVDIVYSPKNPRDIYPLAAGFSVLPPEYLSEPLEGKFRPGHFSGVATVVLKLFGIVRPTIAYFGEKDFQQLEIIKAMVADFFLPIEIVACPTLREKSGLAMSSRNRYLKQKDQKKAALLYKVLRTSKTKKRAKKILKSENFKIDYLESWQGRWLAAVKFKGVRLIDNLKKK